MSEHGSIPPLASPHTDDKVIRRTGPSSHIVWAILSALLFFLPLGVASIVYAAQVNSKWAAGDVAGAQAASSKAKWLAISAVVVWAILTPIVVVFIYRLGAMGASLGSEF
jgi:hypothetical protein